MSQDVLRVFPMVSVVSTMGGVTHALRTQHTMRRQAAISLRSCKYEVFQVYKLGDLVQRGVIAIGPKLPMCFRIEQ